MMRNTSTSAKILEKNAHCSRREQSAEKEAMREQRSRIPQ